eukprot:5928995-Ditylum_brightwellii.AAC.1
MLDVYGGMDKGVDSLVVGLDFGWLLGVVDGFQKIAEAHRCLAVMEQCAALCLHCRANYMFEGLALNEDGGIVWCLVVVESMQVGGAIKIAGDAAFCAIDNKIGSIGVNVQLHVASKKAEHCIWICCQ